MSSSANNVFRKFADNGMEALDIIRKTAYSPNQRKELRHWGIMDVSEMVSRSANYIRSQEKAEKLPQPIIDASTNRRSYRLEDINHLRDFFETRPIKGGNNEPCILAFTNFKGGAAKTTSAVHSAQFLAKRGYRVLLVDCDSQASITQIFGYIPDEDIKEQETLLPFLIGESDSLAPVVRKTYWDGLDLIPANLALYNAEFILPTRANNEAFSFYSILKNGIDTIKDQYDIIVLDCPPSMGMISINAIFAANSLIIPTPPAMLDFTSTVQFFNMLHETLVRLPEKQYNLIRIMITKHDGRASSDAVVSVLRQLYGQFVMLNTMYNSEVIKKASTNMQTLYEIDKYDGSKKTFDRALQYADNLHLELETLIRQTWGLDNEQTI